MSTRALGIQVRVEPLHQVWHLLLRNLCGLHEGINCSFYEPFVAQAPVHQEKCQFRHARFWKRRVVQRRVLLCTLPKHEHWKTDIFCRLSLWGWLALQILMKASCSSRSGWRIYNVTRSAGQTKMFSPIKELVIHAPKGKHVGVLFRRQIFLEIYVWNQMHGPLSCAERDESRMNKAENSSLAERRKCM